MNQCHGGITMITIVNNFRKIRKEKKFTQAEIGKRIGWAQSRVAEFENGRYSVENITLANAVALANALECSFEEVFLTSDDEAAEKSE